VRWAAIVSHRLRSLFARRGVESDLDEEMRYHLERQVEENIALGMTAGEARDAALRSVGGIAQWKEECRDTRGLNLIDNAFQDLRYALRQYAKSFGFTCTAVFVLALGISATVSIYGLVNAALIKPLPYRDQSGLVAVFESSPNWPRSLVSYPDFLDWKSLNRVFRSIGAYAMNGGFTLMAPAGAEWADGTRVSSGFFHTLGIRPLFGRDFYPWEDSPAAPRTVMLSYTAWVKRFGEQRDVLGRTIMLNGVPHRIVGVLPPDFQFAPFGGADFWAILRSSDNCEQHRDCHNLNVIARLKDGIPIEKATAEMHVIARQLQKQYPQSSGEFDAGLAPLRDIVVGEVRPILLVMMTGACVLLLIASVNVTTLLLARSGVRSQEIAVRGALGASTPRLFAQFATEGTLLAGAAGAIALITAQWGMRLLASIVPEERIDSLPWLRNLGMDVSAAVLTGVLSIAAAAIFTIIPFLRTRRPDDAGGLRSGARGASGILWRRFGTHMLVAQMALATLLLVTSGLLAKSLYLLLHVDTGMSTDRLASVQVDWPPGRYSTDDQEVALERRALAAISALPGVLSAAVSLTHPIGSNWGTAEFHSVGQLSHGEHNEALNRQVSPGYFSTIQARLIRGRYFSAAEDARMPRVAIINRSFAARYFAGLDPIGRQIYYDWAPQQPMKIVGVVDDIREGELNAPNGPVLYVPFEQNPPGMFTVLVRTATDPAAIIPQIEATVHHIDRDLSAHDGLPLAARIGGSPVTFLQRSSAGVVGMFAAIAFLLGVVGLYGVVSYSVSQRTREIGVRIALGAAPRSLYHLILGEAARLVGAGAVIGILCSLGAATLIRGLLFGVRSWDVPTMAAAVSVLAAAALTAVFIPARRAASVSPVEALRSE